MPATKASVGYDLIVEDLSNEYQLTYRYTNIQNFLKAKRSFSRNANTDSQISLLLSEINIDENDIDARYAEELLNANSITISDTLMSVDENGSLSTFAINNESSKDFPDIANDNGNTGYISGRIVLIQNSEYDKVLKNKDGEITKFYAYGFSAHFSMDWITDPVYTLTDYFTFAASNGAFCEENNSGTYYADGHYQENLDSTKHYDFDYSTPGSVYYTNGWPVFMFDVPSTVPSMQSTTSYSNHRLRVYSTLYALEDFNIIMSYAHKQLVAGDLTVSISTSGPSISFSGGVGRRVYATPNFYIDVIKDPEMEALKE